MENKEEAQKPDAETVLMKFLDKWEIEEGVNPTEKVLKAMEEYARSETLRLQGEVEELKKENHGQYLKGYSDGRNGLHNADLKEKISELELEKENRELTEVLKRVQPFFKHLEYQEYFNAIKQVIEKK